MYILKKSSVKWTIAAVIVMSLIVGLTCLAPNAFARGNHVKLEPKPVAAAKKVEVQGIKITVKIGLPKLIGFNPTGGYLVSYSKLVFTGKTYGKLPTPIRIGYNFTGWYTKKTGGTRLTSSMKVLTTKTEGYYAHWTKKKK
jgi:uncharacterized repeat protein (TIGR02543 family)